MILSTITASRMLNFQVNRLPSAARMPELARDSGMAPSSTPWGQRYLQKKGSPMPTSLTRNAGSRKTITSSTAYLRYVRGLSFFVESFFVGILCSSS